MPQATLVRLVRSARRCAKKEVCKVQSVSRRGRGAVKVRYMITAFHKGGTV